MKKALIFLLVLVLAVGLIGCGKETGKPVDTASEPVEVGDVEDTKVDFSRMRILIGSTSTGGDTYENADAISRYLEDELGVNTAIDSVGAARAFGELKKAPKNGSTVMFFHDMTYLGVEFGSYSEDFALENWEIGPIVSTNPGNAFLAKHDAPYDTLSEASEWLANNPNETISVAIEAGGVSEILFDAFYLWTKDEYGTEVSDRIRVYVTGGQSDKDQALWDGNADIIYGSMGANAQFTEEGVEDQIKMKFLAVASNERMKGFDVPTFKEQGITFKGAEFAFDKEFFFLLPKDVDPTFIAKLDKAVENVMNKQPQYEEDLNKRTYLKNHKSVKESKEYLYEKRALMQRMISEAPDLDDITN